LAHITGVNGGDKMSSAFDKEDYFVLIFNDAAALAAGTIPAVEEVRTRFGLAKEEIDPRRGVETRNHGAVSIELGFKPRFDIAISKEAGVRLFEANPRHPDVVGGMSAYYEPMGQSA
jgi:hypothetical protein